MYCHIQSGSSNSIWNKIPQNPLRVDCILNILCFDVFTPDSGWPTALTPTPVGSPSCSNWSDSSASSTATQAPGPSEIQNYLWLHSPPLPKRKTISLSILTKYFIFYMWCIIQFPCFLFPLVTTFCSPWLVVGSITTWGQRSGWRRTWTMLVCLKHPVFLSLFMPTFTCTRIQSIVVISLTSQFHVRWPIRVCVELDCTFCIDNNTVYFVSF